MRGKLVEREGQPAVPETADHTAVTLAGDKSTAEVLGNTRMNGLEVAPGQFPIDPIDTRANDGAQGWTSEGGHVLVRCVLAARLYARAMCCRKETTLDLIDPAKLDK